MAREDTRDPLANRWIPMRGMRDREVETARVFEFHERCDVRTENVQVGLACGEHEKRRRVASPALRLVLIVRTREPQHVRDEGSTLGPRVVRERKDVSLELEVGELA